MSLQARVPAVASPRFDVRTVTAAGLPAAAAAVPILVYVWIAVHQAGYPFELDWMEGGSVELAARVLHGQSLYVSPSLAFVGWTYPPLYYWASAAVASLTGIGFLPLRLVSIAGSALAMGALAGIVLRHTGDRVAAIVAAGLFAATFALTGAWFDVGRVDALFTGLTLLTLLVGARCDSGWAGVLTGALAFLAAFTKQSALIALVPALLVLAVTHRRAGLAALVTLAVLFGGSVLLLDAATGGWYRYYVFDELAGQAWVPGFIVGFWRDDLLAHLWPLALLAVGAMTVAVRARRYRGASGEARSDLAPVWCGTSTGWYLAAALAGLLAASWVSRLHTGGYRNVLMPAYAAAALAGGLAYARMRRHGPAGAWGAAALVVVQVAVLHFPVAAQVPTRADRAAGTRLITALRALPGPVLVVRHPWYGTEAGKGAFAQGEGIGDVLRSAAPRGRRALLASLRGVLARDHIATVVADGSFDTTLFADELARYFRLRPGALGAGPPLEPLTDVRTAPALVYVRISAPRSSASAPRSRRTSERAAAGRHR